jgi:hypothetical protein
MSAPLRVRYRESSKRCGTRSRCRLRKRSGCYGEATAAAGSGFRGGGRRGRRRSDRVRLDVVHQPAVAAAESERPHLVDRFLGGPAADFHPIDGRHGPRAVLSSLAVDVRRELGGITGDLEELMDLFLRRRIGEEEARAHRNMDVLHPGLNDPGAFGRIRQKAHDRLVPMLLEITEPRLPRRATACQPRPDLGESNDPRLGDGLGDRLSGARGGGAVIGIGRR